MSASAINNHAPAADFGDAASEFRSLILACGVYELSARARISVTGRDRVRWLNGMVTNSIRDLAAGHGVYAFLLNPQGHILGDLYAFNRGESFLIETDQAQVEKLLPGLQRYIIMDDVKLVNVSGELSAIGIAGPRARQAMQAVGIGIPELAPLQFADLSYRGDNLTLVRGDNLAIDSYQLWLAPDGVKTLWNSLTKAGAASTGVAALELLRVASGIPRYGQDIRERDLPQETEQQRALHFSKGCYIGQEIVERIRSRGQVHRKFTGFEVQGPPPPAAGARIQSDGKDVGEITSVASVPGATGERTLALGYIRRELAGPDKQLQIGSTRLSVADLPFAAVFPPR